MKSKVTLWTYLWVIKKFAEFIVFKWANMAKTTANMKTQKTTFLFMKTKKLNVFKRDQPWKTHQKERIAHWIYFFL